MLILEKKIQNRFHNFTYVTIRDTREFLFLCATRESKKLWYATREFVFCARHENQKNYDTRHATRVIYSFIYFTSYLYKITIKTVFYFATRVVVLLWKTLIQVLRFTTRDTSVYLTMGYTVTSAIFCLTKCLLVKN